MHVFSIYVCLWVCDVYSIYALYMCGECVRVWYMHVMYS